VLQSQISNEYPEKHIRRSYLVQGKGTGKGHPMTCLYRDRREAEVYLILFATLALDYGGVVSITRYSVQEDFEMHT
jgi:hypothetical protein